MKFLGGNLLASSGPPGPKPTVAVAFEPNWQGDGPHVVVTGTGLFAVRIPDDRVNGTLDTLQGSNVVAIPVRPVTATETYVVTVYQITAGVFSRGREVTITQDPQPTGPTTPPAAGAADWSVRTFLSAPGLYQAEILIPPGSPLQGASEITWGQFASGQDPDYPPNFPTVEQTAESGTRVFRLGTGAGAPTRDVAAGAVFAGLYILYRNDGPSGPQAARSDLKTFTAPGAVDPTPGLLLDAQAVVSHASDVQIGRIRLVLSNDFTIPTGWELRWNTDLVSTTQPTTTNTRVMAVGETRVTGAAWPADRTVYSWLRWYSPARAASADPAVRATAWAPAQAMRTLTTSSVVIPSQFLVGGDQWTFEHAPDVAAGRGRVTVNGSNLIDGVARISGSLTTTTAGAQTIERFRLTSKVMPQRSAGVGVEVLLPAGYVGGTARYPVLYMLLGASSPLSTWTGMGNVRSAIGTRPMIVVTIDNDAGNNSDFTAVSTNHWYLDSPVLANSQFLTGFLDEIIPWIDANYRTQGPGKRGVTGFSMGSYGAWIYAARRPAAFNSVSGLSGAYDGYTNGVTTDFLAPVLGGRTAYPDRYVANRPSVLIDAALAQGRTMPRMALYCGTSDSNLSPTRSFRDYLLGKGFSQAATGGGTASAFEYLESAGNHDFTYWSGMALTVIDFHWRAFAAGVASTPTTGVSVPAGKTLRVRVGATETTAGTDANTVAVTPGTPVVPPTVISAGATAYADLFLRDDATGAYERATEYRKSFVVPGGSANIVSVSNVPQMVTAVLDATPGRRIRLPAGRFPGLAAFGPTNPNAARTFSTAISIEPQDRNNPPELTGTQGVTGRSDGTFGDFFGCAGITFDGLILRSYGIDAAGFSTGTLLKFRQCDRISVIDCRLSEARWGIECDNGNTNFLIARNEFWRMTEDSLRVFRAARYFTVRQNFFGPHRDNQGVYDSAHPDHIQMDTVSGFDAAQDMTYEFNEFRAIWTRDGVTYGRPSADIHAHGFFNKMAYWDPRWPFASGQGGKQVVNPASPLHRYAFRRFTIRNNLIEIGHPHGIACQGGYDWTVTRNKLLPTAGTPSTSWPRLYLLPMRDFDGDTPGGLNLVNATDNVWPIAPTGLAYHTGALTGNVVSTSPAVLPTGWVPFTTGPYAQDVAA